MAIILITLLVILLATPSRSHEWYPWECCSGIDCHEVPASEVDLTAGGYRLKDGVVIPYGEERFSPDGKFHVCRRLAGEGKVIYPSEDGEGNPRKVCFWAPPMTGMR